MKEVQADSLSSGAATLDIREIPGLHAATPYARLEDLPVCYEQGFFQGNPLLHPEVQAGQTGMPVNPPPYLLQKDHSVIISLIIAMLMVVCLLKRVEGRFSTMLRDFFFPSNSGKNVYQEDESVSMSFGMSVLPLSLMYGLLTFSFFPLSAQLYSGVTSTAFTILLYTVGWFAFLLLKQAAYRFVHWVFFDSVQKADWEKTSALLYFLETILFFFSLIIVVYSNFSQEKAVLIVVFVWILVKILLFYKDFAIFFGGFYGLLHLIVYFCTLEVVPVWCMARILAKITSVSTMFF